MKNANNQNTLELSRYEIVIINQMLKNALSLATEEEKNSPFNCFQEVEAIQKKLNEYLDK